MADLYSVIPSIEVSQQDILEAELFAKQLLEAKFPDLDLREGTGIRDLTLRPGAFLLALCKKGVDYYFSERTIGSVTDGTDQEIVDDLMGNMFLERNTGSYAVINARLFFAREKSVSLTTATGFSTDGELLFYPQTATTLPESSMTFDAFSNEYYVDIDLVAGEKGSDYNISSGSLLYFTNFDPYFLRAEINYLSQKSSEGETNSEFIARASTAVSTRNLINKPSIDSRLKSDFNYISRLSSVGAGDEEMHRDQLYVNGATGQEQVCYTATMQPTSVVTQGEVSVSYSNSWVLDLANHKLIEGQTVDLEEIGLGVNGYSISKAVVTDVPSVDQVVVNTGVSLVVKTLGNLAVTPSDKSLYVHVGGCVDVYCGDEVTSEAQTFIVGSDNTVTIRGPVMEIVREIGEDDDITDSSYQVSFAGHKTRSDISVVHNSGSLFVQMEAHGLTRGRLVSVTGWPAGTTRLEPVVEVIDEDSVRIGENVPSATPASVISIRYVDPMKDTGATSDQSLTLTFNSNQVGKTVTFRLYSWDKVSSVQEYLDLPENSVVAADYKARGYNVYWITVNAEAYETTGTEASAQNAVVKYLSGLKPGEAFVTADMISAIYDSGVTSLKLPVSVTYQLATRDLCVLPWDVSSGSLMSTYTMPDRLDPFSSNSVFLLKALNLTST